MSDAIISSSSVPISLPQIDVSIRAGTIDDIPFMDELQKMHSKQVGWMPTKQFEGKIKAGDVLIAESNGEPVGYCIGHDQYFKRDDVGIIYQMNVMPGKQRGLIGASLLKAQFERSAWGCRLYCCWCAQDIEANRFWEAMGFVPLAYRAGSEKKARVHIFWQRRIRAGDVTTPWWFPSKTAGGSIREDRIVLPIPPGTHWSDAKPLVLPTDGSPKLEVLDAKEVRKAKPAKQKVETPAPALRNGLMFSIPKPGEPLPEEKPAKAKKPKAEKIKRACDPRMVSAARELRDRWLEQVNSGAYVLEAKRARYEVSRALDVSRAPVASRMLVA
jgi:hypothetical protein